MTFFETLESVKIAGISLNNLLSAVIVFIVCTVSIKILCGVCRRALEKSKLDSGLRSFILSAIKVFFWVIAVLIIAGCLNIPITSLVAVLSVAGLALSLSIQDIMSNLFSGITILATRPFKGGDYVDVGNQSGTVNAIGLFHTVIKTPDNKEIFVPNSKITSADIVNYSAEDVRRVDLTFSASYENSTTQVRSAILQAVNADGRVLPDPAPFVAIDTYAASSIDYVCRVWVKSEDYWGVHFDLNESVRESFAQNGVSFPYNQLDIHLVRDQQQ